MEDDPHRTGSDSDERLALGDVFPVPAIDDWRAVAKLDDAVLNQRNGDGVLSPPLSTSADGPDNIVIASIARAQIEPDEARRGLVSTVVHVDDVPAANAQLLSHFANGGTAAHLRLDNPAAPPATTNDYRALLRNVDPVATPLYFQASANPLEQLALYCGSLRNSEHDIETIAGLVGCDPFLKNSTDRTTAATFGQWCDQLAAATDWAASEAPQLGTIFIDAAELARRGVTGVSELAYAGFATITYHRALADRGLKAETIGRHLHVSLTADTRPLATIAKLRAWKVLWRRLLDLSGAGTALPCHLHVEIVTPDTGKSVNDSDIIRSTVAGLAAAVVGVESTQVPPYDPAVENSAAKRLARNTLLILQHEAHLGRVKDPSQGSWHIDRLTCEYAQTAWSTMAGHDNPEAPLAWLALDKLSPVIPDAVRGQWAKTADSAGAKFDFNRLVAAAADGADTQTLHRQLTSLSRGSHE